MSKVRKAKNIKKVVWAVDPLAEEPKYQKHVLKTLEGFTKGYRCQVLPAYVVSPPNPYLPAKGLKEFYEGTRGAVGGAWKKLVAGTSFASISGPEVLIQNKFSTQKSVQALLKYANAQDADLVAASTHARSGLPRSILGSFAETLVMQSKMPTLVINPRANWRSKVSRILFPTDLSHGAWDVFPDVVNLAKRLGAKIILYHKVDLLNEYSGPVLKNMPMYRDLLNEDLERRQTLMKQFEALSAKQGVITETVLNQGTEYVADAVISCMKKTKPCLIAMASQTGPVASALLGSVTRQVFRSADCPVWVLHPEQKGSKTMAQFENWALNASYLSGLR